MYGQICNLWPQVLTRSQPAGVELPGTARAARPSKRSPSRSCPTNSASKKGSITIVWKVAWAKFLSYLGPVCNCITVVWHSGKTLEVSKSVVVSWKESKNMHFAGNGTAATRSRNACCARDTSPGGGTPARGTAEDRYLLRYNLSKQRKTVKVDILVLIFNVGPDISKMWQ